jgi:hypothetical protein
MAMERIIITRPSRLILLMPMIAIAVFSTALYLRSYTIFQGQNLSKAALNYQVNVSLDKSMPQQKDINTNPSSISSTYASDSVGDTLVETESLAPGDLRL